MPVDASTPCGRSAPDRGATAGASADLQRATGLLNRMTGILDAGR